MPPLWIAGQGPRRPSPISSFSTGGHGMDVDAGQLLFNVCWRQQGIDHTKFSTRLFAIAIRNVQPSTKGEGNCSGILPLDSSHVFGVGGGSATWLALHFIRASLAIGYLPALALLGNVLHSSRTVPDPNEKLVKLNPNTRRSEYCTQNC